MKKVHDVLFKMYVKYTNIHKTAVRHILGQLQIKLKLYNLSYEITVLTSFKILIYT